MIRKERSERLPTKPKPKADKVIFQAMTREWDEKTTAEERRGARAAARKVATLGLYDRNKTVRKLRQKYVSGRIDEEADPEAKKVAQRAVEQVQEAAAKSIQKPKEVLYQEAQGVKRSFARAEALPEGEWERLKTQYKALDQQIKIGRKGCTPALVSAIQNFWRGREVVKLRIHDEKSARKVIFVGDPAVMPTWVCFVVDFAAAALMIASLHLLLSRCASSHSCVLSRLTLTGTECTTHYLLQYNTSILCFVYGCAFQGFCCCQ